MIIVTPETRTVETKLIQSIKNLLTDRHIVNKSFKGEFEATWKELFSKYLAVYE